MKYILFFVVDKVIEDVFQLFLRRYKCITSITETSRQLSWSKKLLKKSQLNMRLLN